jgi:hypothetical protein
MFCRNQSSNTNVINEMSLRGAVRRPPVHGEPVQGEPVWAKRRSNLFISNGHPVLLVDVIIHKVDI